MTSVSSIKAAGSELLSETEKFLCDLVKFPSLSGQEEGAVLFLKEAFDRLSAEVEKVGLSDSIVSDPDYCNPIPDLKYEGRFNLRLARRGSGGGKTLLLNTHVDVVPPSGGMSEPWRPRIEQGKVFGRGACDAKGQIAAIYLALRILETLDVKLAGDVIVHLVVEEENGGNGSLTMIRRGEKADGCICLEPSECKVLTSIRGAVWFRLVLKGKAGHSGQPGETQSSLLMAREAMGILEKYHDELLEESRHLALFDAYPDPMPLTFGRLEAGSWPATTPGEAVLEGVLGLLPNRSKEQVCEEMRQALANCGDDYFAKNFSLSFTYRHDCCVVDPGQELPQKLLGAIKAHASSPEIGVATCSSDAWLYNNQLRIPTVQFGPGSLKVCHSKDEHIDMADIKKSAGILVLFITDYCGND